MTSPRDPKAPHGRDENGTPLAPYGLNLDGTPRKSNRGAKAGQRGNRRRTSATSGPSVSSSNLSDGDRKGMLCDLADMFLVSPLASASMVPGLTARIGKHADALAGDAFILSQYVPGLADGLILWSKTKPGMLSWLDKIEGAAPALVFTNALLAAGKAIAQNHVTPNPNVAKAGRALAAMRIAQMAEAVNQQAAAMSMASDAARAEYDSSAQVFESAAYDNAVRNGADPTLQFAA